MTDRNTFRTTPPRHYLPPTREEMRDVAKEHELKAFSPSLVHDMCNLAAGGEINSVSHWRDEVAAEAARTLHRPDSSGGWQTKSGYTTDRTAAVADRVERAVRYHQNICDFIATLEFDKVPGGGTPLSRAMSVLKALSAQEGGGSTGDCDSLPIFEEKGQEVANDLNDLMDEVESLSDEERELLEDDETSDSAGSGSGAMQKRRIFENMNHEQAIWLQVSRRLDQLAKMKVAKSIRVKPDVEGDEVRSRQIAHLGELPRIAKSAWGLRQQSPTLFWQRALTRQLPVRERVMREERKMLLYMIVDCSGSMGDYDRIAKAIGVLFNRLKGVMAGEAELFVSFFDSSLKEEFSARNKAEAKALMKRFRRSNFSGGGTAIARCAQEANGRIEKKLREGAFCRPELVVVTDGEDRVSASSASEFGETHLHAFVVGGSNQGLLDLARATGGVAIDNL